MRSVNAGWSPLLYCVNDARDLVMQGNTIDLVKAAELLGYERIKWDAGYQCYCGFGSSDPFDRSRDNPSGFYIAPNDEELAKVIEGDSLWLADFNACESIGLDKSQNRFVEYSADGRSVC